MSVYEVKAEATDPRVNGEYSIISSPIPEGQDNITLFEMPISGIHFPEVPREFYFNISLHDKQ